MVWCALTSHPSMSSFLLLLQRSVIPPMVVSLYRRECILKMTAFWDIAPCSLGVDWRFRSADCLHHQGDCLYSKTSVYSKTTQHLIPEGSRLHTHCHENLKSHNIY
jgi:hypothetical protein